MKLILSSSDFINPYSKQVIINNINKKLSDNKAEEYNRLNKI